MDLEDLLKSKITEKMIENLRDGNTFFLYHVKPLKNVQSFIKLSVLEIKILHRFEVDFYTSYWSCTHSNTISKLSRQTRVVRVPITGIRERIKCRFTDLKL